VSADNSYCPVERPFPPSYEAVARRDPAECLAEDPCSPDGVTTLWHAMPCEVTTTVVAVDDPPVLPSTGSGTVALACAFALVGIGTLLRRAAR
jgi:hypothetical protein